MAEQLAPVVNALSRPFWDGAAEGRLFLPFCAATGRAFWPPSPSSPFALGGAVEWREVPAEGTLLARAVYWRAFQRALSGQVPYAVALVEVAPGVRLHAHLADPERQDAPSAGDRVRVAFAALVEGGPSVPFVKAR